MATGAIVRFGVYISSVLGKDNNYVRVAFRGGCLDRRPAVVLRDANVCSKLAH